MPYFNAYYLTHPRPLRRVRGGDHEDAGYWATRDRCARREGGSLDAGRLVGPNRPERRFSGTVGELTVS
jgi:hypothetical protein